MSSKLKNGLKKLLFVLYFFGLMALGTQLFFGDQIVFLANSLNLFHDEGQLHGSKNQVVIGYAYPASSLEPTIFDPVTRSYLVDIYEGLVKTDRNLQIRPGLAVSWGMVDSLTWEFRVRPNVKFHNGNALRLEDVVASIDRAKNYEGSQLKNLLSTIKEVTMVDQDRLRIVTTEPDPLLLNKLALTYIFPKDQQDFAHPVGTGPYRYLNGDFQRITLERFDNYWGIKPLYAQVIQRIIPDRDDRISSLESGTIDLLANLPPSVACSKNPMYASAPKCSQLENQNIQIKSIPSLEVSFLALNPAATVFKDVEARHAVAQALDSQTFVDLAYGFAHPVSQFVSSGVFGFNPEIQNATYDQIAAKKSADKAFASNFERLEVTLDYPDSLGTIAQYVQSQLGELGITVKLNPMADLALQDKIMSHKSDFYFLGWRSELGDGIDFLQSAAHGNAPFNGINYMNKKVDQEIDDAQQNLDNAARLKDMQMAMQQLIDDQYGVPLYESETIYAYTKEINFEPRVDGYIYASELK